MKPPTSLDFPLFIHSGLFPVSYTHLTKIPVAQFTAEGGYYFKILSDARKIVFVYAGASALAGYEAVNWGEEGAA